MTYVLVSKGLDVLTALAPTVALLVAAWLAMRAAKAAKVVQVKVEAVHVLVNDQLTREKASRLAVLRSQYVLMDRLIEGEETEAEVALLKSMSDNIAALSAEIEKRDERADQLAPPPQHPPKRRVLMPKREPAVLIAALMALVQSVVIFVTGDTTASVSWLLPILTVVAGLLTRSQVVPVETILDAGITPAEVKVLAADPAVPRPDETTAATQKDDVRGFVVRLIARAVGKI